MIVFETIVRLFLSLRSNFFNTTIKDIEIYGDRADLTNDFIANEVRGVTRGIAIEL
jgi:hypothetical protein